MSAGLYVDAAAVGIPGGEWLTYPQTLRTAIIAEHNRRINDR